MGGGHLWQLTLGKTPVRVLKERNALEWAGQRAFRRNPASFDSILLPIKTVQDNFFLLLGTEPSRNILRISGDLEDSRGKDSSDSIWLFGLSDLAGPAPERYRAGGRDE